MTADDADKIIKLSKKYDFVKLESVRRMRKFRFDNKWFRKTGDFCFREIKINWLDRPDTRYMADYPVGIIVAVPKFKINEDYGT